MLGKEGGRRQNDQGIHCSSVPLFCLVDWSDVVFCIGITEWRCRGGYFGPNFFGASWRLRLLGLHTQDTELKVAPRSYFKRRVSSENGLFFFLLLQNL